MMKLWLVQRQWPDNYDVLNGALVRAVGEMTARRMVAEAHGDEGYDVWFSAGTRCIEVKAKGEPGILLKDFTNG